MVLVVGGTIAVQASAAYAVGRVSPAPASSTVTEGQSYDVVFTLDAPIIAISDPDPNVTLSLTPDDPSRLTLSPTTVEWDASEWFQPRTLHVTAVADGIHDLSNTDVVHVATTSESEYYSGFATSFTVNITDIDPAPTTTTTVAATTTPATTTLPTATTTRTRLAPPTTVTNPPISTTTMLVVAPAQGELPATGAPIGGLLAGAGVMVASGSLLMQSKRSRAGRAFSRTRERLIVRVEHAWDHSRRTLGQPYSAPVTWCYAKRVAAPTRVPRFRRRLRGRVMSEQEVEIADVIIDCADPTRLASFWADLLGRPIEGSKGPYVWLRPPGANSGRRLSEGRAGRRPPRTACTSISR